MGFKLLKWILPMLLLQVGCGTEIGNPKKPEPSPLNGSIFLTDTTAASGLVTSLFDEVAASGAEAAEAAGTDTALFLQGDSFDIASFALAPKDDRTCVANADGTVTVVRDFNGNFTTEKKRKRATVVTKVAGTDIVSRIYSKPETVLACNGGSTNIRLGLGGFFGMSVASTFERSYEKNLMIKETNKTVWSKKYSAKGTRNWAVSKVDGLEDNQFGYATSESRKADRKVSILKKNGESLDVDSEVGTVDGAPMVIRSVFDKAGKSLVSRTIESGTAYSAQPNDSRVETTFTKVVYTPADGCVPTSGTIEGKIFAAGSTEANLTYTVVFMDDAMSVKFDNGEVIVTQPEYCPAE